MRELPIHYYEKVTKKQCSAKNQDSQSVHETELTVNKPVNLNQPQAWGWGLGVAESLGPLLLFGF